MVTLTRKECVNIFWSQARVRKGVTSTGDENESHNDNNGVVVMPQESERSLMAD